MPYTVHEVAKLSGVTVKTLYHYQKLGLLYPAYRSEAGYRYYGDAELERLQQILVYRALELPLAAIRRLLDSEPDRLRCLHEQRSLLRGRQQRLAEIVGTLEQTIEHLEKGTVMEKENLFNGLNAQQWEQAMEQQNAYLRQQYGVELPATPNPDSMNQAALEAQNFLSHMAAALRQAKPITAPEVATAIGAHIEALNRHRPTDAQAFAAQCRFFMADDFHRAMLEEQQTGLCYYLCCAAEQYAAGA